MSILNSLQHRAEEIQNELGADPEATVELLSELAEIGNVLQLDGGAIDDPRSPLEIALDLDNAETIATRASDYPR
jgi:hypothetical protein